MTVFNPKVSIVIPVYNGSDYMAEAIDSALAQTYNNTEVIVVNDGSNDGGKTREIAFSYEDKIRYFEKENGGVASALNFGIKKMEGEFFSWLSHDDVYYSEKINIQINLMNSIGDQSILFYGGWEVINEKSETILINRLELRHSINDLNKPLYPLFQGIIHGCTLLVPLKCFEEIGLFDESLKTSQDYDLWFKILKRYQVAFHKEILVKSREHPKQGSKKEVNYLSETSDLWIKFIEDTDKDIVKRYTTDLDLFYYKMEKHLKNSPLKKAYLRAVEFSNRSEYEYLFSVILPTHNRAHCIKDAIESVINQSCQEFELIVVDDGSIDNTKEIIIEYTNIKYIYQQNAGASAARNTGLKRAKGKYIAFIDSDDIWHEKHLEKHLLFLEKNREFGMSYNAYIIRNEDQRIINKRIDLNSIDYPRILFISTHSITVPSVVVRSIIFKEIDGFREDMDMCEDLELWSRISRKYLIGHIPECLTTVRLRSDQFEPYKYYEKRKEYLRIVIENDNTLNYSLIAKLYLEIFLFYLNFGVSLKIIMEDLLSLIEKIPDMQGYFEKDICKIAFKNTTINDIMNERGQNQYIISDEAKIESIKTRMLQLMDLRVSKIILLTVIYPIGRFVYKTYKAVFKKKKSCE